MVSSACESQPRAMEPDPTPQYTVAAIERVPRTPPAILPRTPHPPIPATSPQATAPRVPAVLASLGSGHMAFVDARHGWTLGGAIPQPTGDCTRALWRTTDGGRSWQGLGLPFRANPCDLDTGAPPDRDVRGLLFASPQLGWAYGPSLYRTNDGGMTWTELPQPQPIVSLTLAGTRLLAVVGHCQVEVGVCPWRFLTSADQGDSWQPAPSQPGLHGPQVTVIWIDGRQGWLLSWGDREPYRALPSGDRTPADAQLLRTQDGGQTWAPLPTPCRDATTLPDGVLIDGASHVRLAVVDARHLWLLCGSGRSAGQQPKWLVTSADGGQSWSAPRPAPWVGYVTVLSAPTDQLAFLGLTRAGLARTRDGGQTWTGNQSLNVRDLGTPAVAFMDARHGWAIVPDVGVARTDDGGDHWDIIGLP